MKYSLESGVLSMTLSNGCNMIQAQHPETGDPITAVNLDSAVQAIVPPDDWSTYQKLRGVTFEGVMCSGTKDDQAGVTAVLLAYQLAGQSFEPTSFAFENGNSLTLTKENMSVFAAIWMPFRQSFFKP
jgi:hypothetical protein